MMIDIVFHIYSNLGEFLSFSTSSFIKQLLLHDCKRLHKNTKQLLQKNNEQASYGCWQEIPADIMEIIIQRLSLSDRIRLGIVCKSWRFHAMHKDICLVPQLPWLTLPHDPNKKHLASFYDLYTGKVHNMKLPKALRGAVCLGSSKGWLVMAKERPCHLLDLVYAVKETINVPVILKSFDDFITLITKPIPDTKIFLFNPISRALHQLPSLSTIPSYYPIVWSTRNEEYNTSCIILRIALSSTDSSECIVAAILLGCEGYKLAFCRPGDKQWSIFRGKDDRECYEIDDILFIKGTLYALIRGETEGVENHTFGLVDCEVSLKFIPCLNREEDGNFGIMTEGIWWDEYMVESTNGELLLICRNYNILASAYDFKYEKTNAFKVFKKDPNTGHLSRQQSLGDQVVFLVHGGSQSCLAKDYVGVQGNCIYFAADIDDSITKFTHLFSRESGVYYLEDGKMERSFPSGNFPLQSRVSWFTPVL